MPIRLLCVSIGLDSVDHDSKQNGRPDDFGVPFQGLKLNIATNSVDRTISVCRKSKLFLKWFLASSWNALVLPNDVMVFMDIVEI